MTIKIADILMHVRKKPIDHPESSILFAHLSKEVKEELLRLALSTLMNRALLNAETKDFYVILADVRTADYPNGYYGTIQFKGARTPITVTEQSGNDLTDYAVKIELDDTWDGWNAVLDGSDIYFLDENGNPLYFWIEYFNKTEKKAIIWVKIPSLPANSSITIYMYYGSLPNPYADYNNPEQIFMFFDDFEGTELDTSKWVVVMGSAPVVSDSMMILDSPTQRVHSTYIVNGYNNPVIVEMRIRNYNIRMAGLSNSALDDPDFKNWIGISDKDFTRAWAELNDDSFYVSHNFNDDQWKIIQIKWSSTDVYINKIMNDTVTQVLHKTPSDGNGIPNYDAWIYFYIYSGDPSPHLYVDWVRVRQYVEPEPSVNVGACESAEAETANLDFPDGIDKILVTADSDAQEAYYSIDGGQTWNPLVLDEEILLPETAYQLKLKFSNLTYFRGYALIGW